MATREQVEAVLRARGLREEKPGDWIGDGATVYLDIAHSPDMAWYYPMYNGNRMEKRVLTYDEVIARFS